MQALPQDMSPALIRVCRLYEKLDKTSTELLKSVYATDITFRDPLHEVQGIRALNAYFAELYANVDSIEFAFHQPLGPLNSGDEGHESGLAWLSWTMTYRHPRLNRGLDITVEGASRLEFHEGHVIHHRDFFDAGELLYEQLPVLRNVIGLLKRRLG
ncbi:MULTISPECIES: nuclear transport factor 2 family protein [Cobetia]|nr:MULTISPECIES: nuclear transport factor 2 family protein [Cobetia]